LLVGDFYGCRGGEGLLVGFGEDEGDVLAPVADVVVDEGWAGFAGAPAASAGGHAVVGEHVFEGEDEDDAGHFLGFAGVNAADYAAGDGAGDGTPWTIPGKWKSAAYWAMPEVLRGPSMRGRSEPMMADGVKAAVSGMERPRARTFCLSLI